MAKKRCGHCGKVKTLSEFSKHACTKDGYRSQCKSCIKQYNQDHKDEIAVRQARYYQDRKDDLLERAKQYYCEHRDERIQYYYEHIDEIKKYRQERRDDRIAYAAQYRQEHKDEISVNHAQYYQDHKEDVSKRIAQYHKTTNGKAVRKASRARRRSTNYDYVSADTMKEVMSASDNICPYCGNLFTDGHIDHIVPVSKGGTNEKNNLVYCCATCNHRKHSKSLEEFMSQTGRLALIPDISHL